MTESLLVAARAGALVALATFALAVLGHAEFRVPSVVALVGGAVAATALAAAIVPAALRLADRLAPARPRRHCHG